MKIYYSLWIALMIIFISLPTACRKTEEPGEHAAEAEEKPQFPPTTEGAKSLLSRFLKPDADKAALTRELRPRHEDFQAVFIAASVSRAEQGYQVPWDEGQIVIRGNPDQTELLLWAASSGELKKGTGDSEFFPAGYMKAAPHFKDGLTFYRFKFVRPGEATGFAWDGLVFVNGRWVIFPKPWRVVGDN